MIVAYQLWNSTLLWVSRKCFVVGAIMRLQDYSNVDAWRTYRCAETIIGVYISSIRIGHFCTVFPVQKKMVAAWQLKYLRFQTIIAATNQFVGTEKRRIFLRTIKQFFAEYRIWWEQNWISRKDSVAVIVVLKVWISFQFGFACISVSKF